ncbi:TlpA disulfide reductase family protein [Paraflavitalea sp. CAU 1676]|uniref:TlpA disulfide reductase family protein n=1 Tax=Paraflavitalea sp. CAU 1676 TaxID=3032598 RepID=UPI0023DC42F3|nr:TlpA disulfide reductase family protein [Paraflavitalea sp. CAU 1676]MDF2192351.1 TlpA disulfide reductase family protein [Paraflavitalea sp. CAU 1676]
MQQLLLAFVFTVSSFGATAQKINYQITGTVERVTGSKKITLSVRGEDKTTKIADDGSFSFSGTLDKAGEAHISTETSTIIFIWLDEGNLVMNFAEWKMNGRCLLRTTHVSGNDDSYLYFTKTLITRDPIIPTSQEEYATLAQKKYYAYLDSLMTAKPNSKVLVHHIRFFSKQLGEVNTGKLYNRLPESEQMTDAGALIRNYLAQRTALKVGSTFPDFELSDVDGKPFKISSIKASYILVDFWDSHCGPCRVAHKENKVMKGKFNDPRFEIVSISVDTKKHEWLKALKDQDLPWPQAVDLKGFESDIAKHIQLNAIPFSVLLDGNMKIIGVGMDDGSLEPTLAKLMGYKMGPDKNEKIAQ